MSDSVNPTAAAPRRAEYVIQYRPARDLRLDLDLGLDEDKRRILLLLALPLLFQPACFEFLRAGLKQAQPRGQEEGGQEQHVRHDRVGDAFAPRDRAANDELVLVPLFEIEMDQGNSVHHDFRVCARYRD